LVLGPSTGGIGAHVASLTAGLARHGVQVTVAGPAATGRRFGFDRLGGAFVPVEPAAGWGRLGELAAPLGLRAALGGDAGPGVRRVVHAHGLRAGLTAALALTRVPATPLIVSLHNAILSAGLPGAVARTLTGRLTRRADLVLGASADLVRAAVASGARDARLAPVSAPALPPPRRAPAEVRAELDAGERPLLLAVGRLAPQKDYPTLLDAAARWRQAHPQPLLVIAGEGPQRADLAARISAERLPVRLLGHREDVADLLAAADLAVLSSRWEARALIAQEALRSGTPLVATAVGGVPDLVGEAALLVPPADPAALAGAVRTLLADPAARAALASAGAAKAATWPDERDTIEQVLSMYREVSGF
jgi:glycosyltransferase involved in cell wall biosynthesis